jgi:transcriptional regulator of acetoin/glycerol metabolism
MALDEIEKEAILATLQRADGNIKKAAGLLGIDRSTLYDKLKKYKDRRS